MANALGKPSVGIINEGLFQQAKSRQNRADQNASRSAGMARQVSGNAGTLARMGQDLYQQYGRTYAPLHQQMADSAYIDPSILENTAAQTVNQQFDVAEGRRDRNLSRMGVNPNSGRWASSIDNWELARQAALAGAIARARREGRLDNFNRLRSALSMGGNLLSGARGAIGSSTNAYSTAGSMFGGLANMWDRSAENAAHAAHVAGNSYDEFF